MESDDLEAVLEVLKSNWLTTGPFVDQFEEQLAFYCGAKYAVVFSSGTAALHAAYFAAEVQPGDEVITTPISFAATANAALYLGAKPVFVDVQPDTINIDPEKVKEAVTSRTKVIAPVDFAGHPADLDELMALARETGAVVVEDACHALGATYRGRRVGSIAHMTVFSFHPVKSITTGEGGAVLTNDPVYNERLRLFRNHGITRDRTRMHSDDGPWYYEMHELGYNYRLSDIHSALGLSQLAKVERFVSTRRSLARTYHAAFTGPEFVRPVERPYVQSAWHLYTLQLADPGLRHQLVTALHRVGIGVQVHYLPIYRHPFYRRIGYGDCYCPNAERYYSRCLSLPLYPKLSVAEQHRTIDAIHHLVARAVKRRKNLRS